MNGTALLVAQWLWKDTPRSASLSADESDLYGERRLKCGGTSAREFVSVHRECRRYQGYTFPFHAG